MKKEEGKSSFGFFFFFSFSTDFQHLEATGLILLKLLHIAELVAVIWRWGLEGNLPRCWQLASRFQQVFQVRNFVKGSRASDGLLSSRAQKGDKYTTEHI